MKIRTIAAVAALSALFNTGCMNVVLRPQAEYNQGVYFYTAQDGKLIKRGFERHPIEQMLLPLTIVDYPLDAVVDTLFLPWDGLMTIRHNRENRKLSHGGLKMSNDGMTVEFGKEY